MTEKPPEPEIEVKTAVGSVRARGYDLLVVLIVVALAANGVIQYYHMEDAKFAASAAASNSRDVAKAIQDGNRVQRLSACIAATDPDKKEAQYMQPNSFCNRISQ